MQTHDKFWMVFVEGGRAPAFKHESEASARAEAERLARSERTRVYVLQATEMVELADVKWNRLLPPLINTNQFGSIKKCPHCGSINVIPGCIMGVEYCATCQKNWMVKR